MWSENEVLLRNNNSFYHYNIDIVVTYGNALRDASKYLRVKCYRFAFKYISK